MTSLNGQQPTKAEIAILQVLWRRGKSTVRDVHEDLQATRPGGYTTILKLMQIMTKKGLVRRDESARTHFYEAAPSKDQTQQHLVRDLVQRAFEGSAQQLVMQALSTEPSTKAELQEIRKLLDDLEGRAP